MEEPEGVAAVTSTSAAVVASECPAHTFSSAVKQTSAAAASATPQQQVENGAESHTLPGSFTSVALAVLFCAGVMVL